MASSIVTSAARQLGTLLADEAKYLYAVSDKIKNMQSELEWMQCFLQDVDNREHQESVARKWVAEIREFAYEAEDIVERYVAKVSHHRRNGMWNTVKWFSCVWGDALTLHDLGSSMDDLSNRISKMVSRLQIYGVHISTKQPECPTCNLPTKKPQSSSYDRMEHFRLAFVDTEHENEETVGLETETEKLVVEELVTKGDVNVVGIFGRSGSGKTTLARKVYLHKNVEQRFKNRVWVFVFEQEGSFESRNVFEEMLTGLCGNGEEDHGVREKIKELTSEELRTRLCEVLEKEDCLVVLDEVLTDWYILDPTFESIKRGGSKILITSPNIEMCRDAELYGHSYSIGSYIESYGLEDRWLLLQQTTFIQQQSTGEKEELCKEMLRHFSGYPMEIVALGGILATKNTDEEWETVSRNIAQLIEDTEQFGKDRLVALLELSYSELPSYLKSCFMYLGSFPYGSEILADRLYHLWQVEGFITISEDDGANILDDVAEYYLCQLVRRRLVQVDKRWPLGFIKSCRLHPIIRAFCLNKCREANFVDIIERGSSEAAGVLSYSRDRTKSRRRAIHWIDDESDPSDAVGLNEGPYLRSLTVFSNESYMAEKLLSRKMSDFLSLLRVLDLQGAVVSPQCNVGAIKYCIHLRYLSLRGTRSAKNRVPNIWACVFLETLDLRIRYKSANSTPIEIGNKLWKLTRLRHLYLPDHDFVVLEDDKLRLTPAQLGQLETLINFNAKRCQIEGLRKTMNLRTFSFNTSIIEDKAALEHLLNASDAQSRLKCCAFQLNISANAINEDPTIWRPMANFTIWISRMGIFGRIDEASSEEGRIRRIFPSMLQRLDLEDCEILGEGVLQLEKLPFLEELKLSKLAIRGSKMRFSQGSFQKLVKLTLKDMKALEEWEVGEDALPRLLHLAILGCSNLKMIPQNLGSSLRICCYPSDINGSETYVHYTDSSTYLRQGQDSMKPSFFDELNVCFSVC